MHDPDDHLVRTGVTEGRAAVRVIRCGYLEPVDVAGFAAGSGECGEW